MTLKQKTSHSYSTTWYVPMNSAMCNYLCSSSQTLQSNNNASQFLNSVVLSDAYTTNPSTPKWPKRGHSLFQEPPNPKFPTHRRLSPQINMWSNVLQSTFCAKSSKLFLYYETYCMRKVTRLHDRTWYSPPSHATGVFRHSTNLIIFLLMESFSL